VIEALAQAGTAALLGAEPDVLHLRAEIGLELIQRIETASGAEADAELTETICITFLGAMLYAGAGGFEFGEVARPVETVARLFALK